MSVCGRRRHAGEKAGRHAKRRSAPCDAQPSSMSCRGELKQAKSGQGLFFFMGDLPPHMGTSSDVLIRFADTAVTSIGYVTDAPSVLPGGSCTPAPLLTWILKRAYRTRRALVAWDAPRCDTPAEGHVLRPLVKRLCAALNRQVAFSDYFCSAATDAALPTFSATLGAGPGNNRSARTHSCEDDGNPVRCWRPFKSRTT